MVQGYMQFNAALRQCRDQLVIKGKARFIPRALPIGLNPWPRDGEPVGIDSQLRYQFDVLCPPLIVFAGNVSIASICNFSFDVAKGIPDRRAFAIAVMTTFNLEGRCCNAPFEVFGKL